MTSFSRYTIESILNLGFVEDSELYENVWDGDTAFENGFSDFSHFSGIENAYFGDNANSNIFESYENAFQGERDDEPEDDVIYIDQDDEFLFDPDYYTHVRDIANKNAPDPEVELDQEDDIVFIDEDDEIASANEPQFRFAEENNVYFDNDFIQIDDENARRCDGVIEIDDSAEYDDGFEKEYVGFEVKEAYAEEEVVDLVTVNMIHKKIPQKYLTPFYHNWTREVVMRKMETSLKSAQVNIN